MWRFLLLLVLLILIMISKIRGMEIPYSLLVYTKYLLFNSKQRFYTHLVDLKLGQKVKVGPLPVHVSFCDCVHAELLECVSDIIESILVRNSTDHLGKDNMGNRRQADLY